MIDIHRLNFYLTVRQDVDRVVGGFIRNLRDTENGKLRRTLSFDQYSMDQRDLSLMSSTQEFYSARHLPQTVSSFPNCSSGPFQQLFDKHLWTFARTLKLLMWVLILPPSPRNSRTQLRQKMVMAGRVFPIILRA